MSAASRLRPRPRYRQHALQPIFCLWLLAGKSAIEKTTGVVRTISKSQLFMSEPNPAWFGNRPNPEFREPGWTNRNWLKSRFHFNFAEYDEGPSGFGVLRVMNDDLVQPKRGFGMYPSRISQLCR